jgi:competence protein ComEA
MSIEDFVWDEASENAGNGVAPSGDVEAALGSAGASSWFQRLRGSVWLEPALKIFGLALLLGVLAGIGVVASSYTTAGRALPSEPAALAAAFGSSWLKPSGPAHAAPGIAAGAAGSAVAVAAEAPTLAPAPSTEAPPSTDAPPSSGITPDGRVILNVASAEELTKLPGIGAKRAQAIVALRAKLKRFTRPSDLLRVKGIGPRSLQRMLPHLVLDPPRA